MQGRHATDRAGGAMRGSKELSLGMNIARGRAIYSWGSALLAWHDSSWLQARRLERGSSSLAGRTGTRSAAGRPQQRWDQGISFAKAR